MATVQFALRIPIELKDWLMQQAQKNDRSMNAEIMHLLRQRAAETPESSRKSG